MAYRVFRFAVINVKLRILVFSIMSSSSVNRAVLIEAGSLIQAGSLKKILIEAWGSDTIVLIEAGGFY